MHRWISILVLLALCAPLGYAQESASSALINQALDKQTKLNLSGSLPEAMAQIAKQTGVPIEAQAAVWELLPWGKDTTVTAKIENQTLREALQVITSRLGLVFVLKSEAIELQPMPALKRLGRKSTVSELESLYLLSITPLELKGDKLTLKAIIDALDAKLDAAKSAFAVENRTATSSNKLQQDTPVSVARNATLADALNAIDGQTAGTWYPWGKSIVVLPKHDQVLRMLQKEITLRHDGTDVAQVLSELSVRSGVPFRYEPGTFQELAPQSRNIRLVLSATVLDALEAISGLTGLGYQVKDDEVYFWNTQSTVARPRDPIVAWIQTETGLTLIITESQCPPDVREFIESQKHKQYDALRKMMAEQGFKPTNPATQPAPKTNNKSTEKPKDL